MASSNIRALEIAPEPSYCNLTNGAPSVTGLEFTAVEFIDASQITPISDTFQDTEGGRSGYYANPPEPLMTPEGNPVKRGTLTIDFYLRPTGGEVDLLSGLRLLLATRMKINIDSGSASVVSTWTTGESVTIDDEEATVGGVMGFQNAAGSQVRYTHIRSYSLDSDNQTCDCIPPLNGMVSAGDTAFCLNDFRIPSKGGDPVKNGAISPLSTTSQPTVALRLTGDGWRQVCYGCAMTALTITGTGTDTRAVKCTATIDCAYCEDVTPTTDYPLPERLGGRIEHSLGAPLVISDDYTDDAPPTSSYLSNPGQCVDAWTLTLTWTCEASTCGNTYVGRAPLEATDLQASLDMTLGGTATLSDFVTQWETMKKRGVSLGFSGLYEDNQGGAIIIPAAVVSDGSVATVDLGAGFVRTHIMLSPGAYMLDSSGDQPMLQIALM